MVESRSLILVVRYPNKICMYLFVKISISYVVWVLKNMTIFFMILIQTVCKLLSTVTICNYFNMTQSPPGVEGKI